MEKLPSRGSFYLTRIPPTMDNRDPHTAWSAHRSVRVGAILFGFIGAGAVRFEFFKHFAVLVRCGPNFGKFCGPGAVRS